MSLDQKDLELLETVLYRNSDNIGIAIGRSFERLEEHMDNMESRIYKRLAEIDEHSEDVKQILKDNFDLIREDLREIGKINLEV